MNILNDWRKQASQVIEDEQTELAFRDQAYGFIQNKARELMKDPYRIGFEIVHKDDDNTRMAGIFAFRIGKELLYAPVFFINGEIKGHDLLYKHSTKTMVPLNEDWVNFLLETLETDPGKGTPKGRRSRSSTNSLNMQTLSSPPSGGSGRKQASEILKEASEQFPFEAVLRDFILEDGGPKAVEVIGLAMEKSIKFANNILKLAGEDAIMPAELLEPKVASKFAPKQEKKASVKKPLVVLHKGLYNPNTIKCASDEYHRKGYWLEDNRPEESKSVVVNEVSDPEGMTTLNTPGVYEVPENGTNTLVKVFAAPLQDGEDSCLAGCNCYSCSQPLGIDTLVITLEGGRRTYTHRVSSYRKPKPVYGFPVDTDKDFIEENSSIFEETPKGGGLYYVYDSNCNKFYDQVLRVKSVKDRDGLKVVELEYKDDPIVINRDYSKTCLEDNIVGKGSYFVKVDKDGDEDYSSPKSFNIASNLDWYIYENKGTTLTVDATKRNGEGFSFGTGKMDKSPELDKFAAELSLVKDFHVGVDVANEILTKAKEAGVKKFHIIPPVGATLKSAASVYITDEEDFSPDSSDNTFGVPMDGSHSQDLKSEEDSPENDETGIGEVWDPTMGASRLLNDSPESLAQMAKDLNAPTLFEHGAVGSLVKTYDSTAMIDKYIPKLEDAVDSLGRILFLFYWKPQDFKDAYGLDDLSNKEDELLSNFKSLGAIVLDLHKKSNKTQSGSNPLL